MNVLVMGATGLTGRLVVEKLLGRSEITSVVVPVRRSLGLDNPKLVEQVIDFDHLEAHAGIFEVDALVCCLGTTIKKAGSQEAFRKVDYDYALTAATLAHIGGAQTMILMSAVGASSGSSVFYSRVKGELEDAVRGLGFPCLAIYHPSLLLGDRKEQRAGEALGMAMMPVANRALLGPMRKYRAIEAETVAAAMVNDLVKLTIGAGSGSVVKVREYGDIVRLAKRG
ncbi:nucleoside-diphosphate sugar epimerase [Marinobacter halophilus]|uniref:Nucleoside-diphosphate sugar epimerase n=1 Tax=Marinobacter halophilus TaxID=1323740 RepID=A0A2T1KCZ4_9GAMM|nr:nucleoside-diphosphate sugar epimerase [Marinobacter halophilus]PSF08014.1 nucleoside-diphosphate sugar epimerase [Marinobacter halophilus]GGC59008.1 NAD-dependent dehydratase [Marinobacter halophilus]